MIAYRIFGLLAFLIPLACGVSWYDYYTEGGIKEGLVPASADGFTLNGKPFRLVSGTIHYFRVHPAYWRDRLKKLRAVGANTVETYIPWNLHEPRKSDFDFGDKDNDMSDFLNLNSFVQIAKEEDLFVILRPGPYICAEWEFGGLPSWLLRDPNMVVRSSYSGFLDAADAYLEQFYLRVKELQFTNGNGPIIAFQIENEYGAYNLTDGSKDTAYMEHLKNKSLEYGAKEMFFTSDTPSKFHQQGTLPDVLQTANFQQGAAKEFDLLEEYQPNKPKMATEFWSGWFDHWGQGFHDQGSTKNEFAKELETIFSRNGSVNFYMFHGGTSFGFMNGANSLPIFPHYAPDISSYDYDAPLTEAGDYTDKYYAAQELIARYNIVPNIDVPVMPNETPKVAYDNITAEKYLSLEDLLGQVDENSVIQSPDVLAMEDLNINNGNGQSYGFILYRNDKVTFADWNETMEYTLTTSEHVRDLAVPFLDGKRLKLLDTGVGLDVGWFTDLQVVLFGYWALPNRKLTFTVNKGEGDHTIDLLVENMGRNNFGFKPKAFAQKKGLSEGPVLLDDEKLSGWKIYPLEFTSKWVQSLTGWKNIPVINVPDVTITRAILDITDEPADTFINFSEWGLGNRGVVFVNGFNIGRFSGIGPVKTLYVPAPLLKKGENTIDVFALFKPVKNIVFSNKPDLGRIIRPDTPTGTPVTEVPSSTTVKPGETTPAESTTSQAWRIAAQISPFIAVLAVLLSHLL